MWLPKDERKTLRKYHSHIHNIDESIRFTDLSEKAYNATRNLIERGLILEIKEGGKEHTEYMMNYFLGDPINLKDFLSFSEENEIRQNVVLKFTLNGLDLANKYDNWWSRSNLWYAEHIKNHWIWLILSFLGGVISTLLINWLSTYLQRTPSAK
jgi:hypothetical protein